MKIKKSAFVLSVILLLTSCGTPETAEAIATTATTAAATEMSTTAATTATTVATTKSETTTTTPTTTTPPETTTEATTTEFIREIYELEFPEEFLSDTYMQPPWLEIPDEAYEIEISDEAEKLYADLDSFVNTLLLAEYPSYEYDGEIYTPGYYKEGSGYQLASVGRAAFGIIDIDNNGVPEVFRFITQGFQGYVPVVFFDMYAEDPFTSISKYAYRGFCRDGLTYFGRNEEGNLLICSGYRHSIHLGEINIAEFLYDSEAPTYRITMGKDFAAALSFNGSMFCNGMTVNGETFGKGAENVPAADFEAAYREFYDAIDFDVYWICGDILYHGAEETEYKGKVAYEKYLEFTRNQALLNDIYDHQKNYDKLLIDDINNDGIVEIVYVKPDLKIFTYYSNGQIKTLLSLANVGGNCECGSAPIYYNKNTDEIMIRRSFSDYKDICFYEYTDGDYNLIKQYKWGGFTVPLEIDEWYESPALDALLQEENLTFEDLKKLDEDKLYEYAHMIGYWEKMDQYMFEDEIITKAEWENAINEFISSDGCISLCPYNTDLDFVDTRSKDFSDYVEKELFNN